MHEKSPFEVQTCEGPCTTCAVWAIGFVRGHTLVVQYWPVMVGRSVWRRREKWSAAFKRSRLGHEGERDEHKESESGWQEMKARRSTSGMKRGS